MEISVEGFKFATRSKSGHRFVLKDHDVRCFVGEQQLLDLLFVAGGDVFTTHGNVGVGLREAVEDLAPHLVLPIRAPVRDAQLAIFVGEVVGIGVAKQPEEATHGETDCGEQAQSVGGAIKLVAGTECAPSQRQAAQQPKNDVHCLWPVAFYYYVEVSFRRNSSSF